ncbi:MAG: hypothetical protein KC619_33465 [Myxococcales bacterium]|nr:hypothetical protein [Myxococcales bacterium]
MGGAVVPRGLQAKEDVAAGEELEALGGDARAQVAGDALEAGAVVGADGDAGVEVEAAALAAVAVELGAGLEPHEGADVAGAFAEDGVLVEVGELGEVVGVDRAAAFVVADPEAYADEVALDAAGDEVAQGLELVRGGGGDGVERELAARGLGPDAVGAEGVEVDVEVQGADEDTPRISPHSFVTPTPRASIPDLTTKWPRRDRSAPRQTLGHGSARLDAPSCPRPPWSSRRPCRRSLGAWRLLGRTAWWS